MSRKVRMAVSGLALLVIVALAWFLLISPLRAEIAQTDSAISAERDRLAAAQAKLAQAEITRAEGKKNQARLIELAKMVPQSAQIPSLLVQIQDLADQAGIDFLSITPGDPKGTGGGFEIVPLTLQFTGTYFDLKDFAYRAEQLVSGPGRLLTLKSLQLGLIGTAQADGKTTVKEGKSPTLSVAMTLYAFSMDQAALAAPAAVSTTGQKTGSSAGATGAAAGASKATTTTSLR